MVTYNHEEYIEKSLRSILNQKGDVNFEIVIYDDRSTDSTLERILDITRDVETSIQVIQPNENRYSKGFTPFYDTIVASNGDYLAFCEGDDYWSDEFKLAKQLSELERYQDLDICFHPSYTAINSNIIDKLYGFNGNYIKIFKLKDVVLSGGSMMPMASIMMKKSAFQRAEMIYSSEFLSKNMWHSTIQIIGARSGKVLYIPEKMSVYRYMHNGSWSHSQSKSIEARTSTFKSFMSRNRHLKIGFKPHEKLYFDLIYLLRVVHFVRFNKLGLIDTLRLLKLSAQNFFKSR